MSDMVLCRCGAEMVAGEPERQQHEVGFILRWPYTCGCGNQILLIDRIRILGIPSARSSETDWPEKLQEFGQLR